LSVKTFLIPSFKTQQGATLDLQLTYVTRGQLSAARDNVVLVLTSYGAQHGSDGALVADNQLVDMSTKFVIVINMFGNGLSSSPSNTPSPFDGPRFPVLTIHDNVACQTLLIRHLGIECIQLVMGFSMGGLQAFEWASQNPDRVDAVLPICSAARVSRHNGVFLGGAKAALEADCAFADGDYTQPPVKGLLAFGRVYAGWVFSQTFFREARYQALGLASVEAVVEFLQAFFMRRDANDLLAMLQTWQLADISANEVYRRNFEAALKAIKARVILLPCESDLYFTVADSALELTHLRNAELRPIVSQMGHFAGGGMDPVGKLSIDQAVADLVG
jgi:homoserine O-acetyltransferase/O-succinyltransferase